MKPNILFIMTDQMSAKGLRFYGNKTALSPSLSRLAEEGVVFENAYCNSPLCGPSRLSMMAGRLPSRVGAYDNAAELSANTPTFAHYLRLLGYKICLSGKMHFAGPDQLHGYEERLTTDIYPSDFGWTPNWAEPEAAVTFQDMQNVIETGPCARSMQIDYDDETAYRGIRWIYDQARSDDDRPFMLTVSFTSPHDPYVALPEFWNLYSTDDIGLPEVPAIPFEQADVHSQRIREHYSIDKVNVTDADLRRLRHGYYASISYIDSKVGALMTALEQSGQAENTIVVFTSDHGDSMGERGLYYKKSFFEWSLRVPLILWAPERFASRRVENVVSLLDLMPTFVDMAGGSKEEILLADGDSLLSIANGGKLESRTIAAEFLSEGVYEPTFLLRDEQYKFFYSEIDPPLLYDMHVDPAELNNLANSPDYADIVKGFRKLGEAMWNGAELKARIIDDQNRRRLINKSHKLGIPPKWDFQPVEDASNQYVRAGKWTTVVEAKAHLDVQ